MGEILLEDVEDGVALRAGVVHVFLVVRLIDGEFGVKEEAARYHRIPVGVRLAAKIRRGPGFHVRVARLGTPACVKQRDAGAGGAFGADFVVTLIYTGNDGFDPHLRGEVIRGGSGCRGDVATFCDFTRCKCVGFTVESVGVTAVEFRPAGCAFTFRNGDVGEKPSPGALLDCYISCLQAMALARDAGRTASAGDGLFHAPAFYEERETERCNAGIVPRPKRQGAATVLLVM